MTQSGGDGRYASPDGNDRDTTGGVISPLLANLYLHWLDHTWVKKAFANRPYDAHIVRYANDFVILCNKNPEFYLGEAKKVLDRLGLTLNAQKTRIVDAREEPFDFLGHRFVAQPSKVTGKLKSYYYYYYYYPRPRR
ncbi:Retron-type RNA-directed DNA polymerase [Candidatus Burkholderia pumila]|uniref:Retron-type RNA-directed DNA polymerase n=1 Tax=Candidatus Burkholderia pumila TaxID=1090375 RepID=A0ABR5HJL8_9BURK|nr:Retron-type RNA-directed DNA polymerase [Candidatus Burkholderia pumila]